MTAGHPRIFKTVEELDKAIDKYFKKNPDDTSTITGLALALGFESRQSFYDYESIPEYSYSIKKSRTRIENSYEISLREGKNAAGNIFGLKNIGRWTDKHEIDQNINANIKNTDVDMTKWPTADLDTMEALIKKNEAADEG